MLTGIRLDVFKVAISQKNVPEIKKLLRDYADIEVDIMLAAEVLIDLSDGEPASQLERLELNTFIYPASNPIMHDRYMKSLKSFLQSAVQRVQVKLVSRI